VRSRITAALCALDAREPDALVAGDRHATLAAAVALLGIGPAAAAGRAATSRARRDGGC